MESDLTSVYAAYGSRAAAFPSYYDSRQKGLVTSVKDQHPFGTCWAFGMAAIMESSLLAQNKGTYDLSEEHLSYFFSNRQNDRSARLITTNTLDVSVLVKLKTVQSLLTRN